MQLTIKKMLSLLSLLLMFFSLASIAQNNKTPLPASKAFVLSVSVESPDKIIAHFKIAPGNYLYRDHIRFTFKPPLTANVHFPPGETHYIEDERKQLVVYTKDVDIPVILPANAPKQVHLTVDFQGCSNEKFCYPPLQQNITLNLTEKSAIHHDVNTPGLQNLLTNQEKINVLLQTQHTAVLLLLFAGLGLLLAFTPCVLPMIPILMGIILGQKKPLTTKKAFLLSLTYVLGSAIIYAVAGVIAASVGSSLQLWLEKPLVISVTSVLFVLLALSLFGFYEFNIPRQWQHRMHLWSSKQRAGTYVGVFFMGMISSLIVSPCVTAPLVGVLIYIGHTGNVALGASALFTMGIGMGVPLLLLGMSAGKWLPKTGPWMEAVKKIFGFLMLAMAVWLFSRFVAPSITLSLWVTLLFITALFFAFYLPRLIGLHIFNRSLGVIIGLASLFMLMMMTGLLPPSLANYWMGTEQQLANLTHHFIVVRDNSELTKHLSLAQSLQKPAIVDFYADWCESCIAMDHKVFKQPEVQRMLGQYVLLRVDLTKNTEADADILKSYNVVAPPTVLFFDAKGQEINSQRIIGEVSAKEFLARLDTIKSQLSSFDTVSNPIPS